LLKRGRELGRHVDGPGRVIQLEENVSQARRKAE